MALRSGKGFSPKIAHDVFGIYNGFAQQGHARRGHFYTKPNETQQTVGLRQVLASSTQLFPNECRRVDAQHIYTQIGIKKYVVEHGHQHLRVAVVQIPLVVVKHAHYPFVKLGYIGKISRCCFRKNFGHGFFEGIGHLPVRIHVVEVLIYCIAAARFLRPLVLVAGMVQHNIYH